MKATHKITMDGSKWTGASFCKYHAEQIAQEYLDKLGEKWNVDELSLYAGIPLWDCRECIKEQGEERGGK